MDQRRYVSERYVKSRRELITDIVIGTIASAAIAGFALSDQSSEQPAPTPEWQLPLVD